MRENAPGGISDAQRRLLEESGTSSRPHSGRTLMAHLLGTHSLLTAWKAPEHVRLGALFHSIYGTNAFIHHSLQLSDRGRVRACIGDEAEQLAHLFCTINRPQALIDSVNGKAIVDRLTGEALTLSRDELRDLLLIECANLIEQGGRSRSLSDIFCVALSDKSLLPQEAYAALRAHLSTPAVKKSTLSEVRA